MECFRCGAPLMNGRLKNLCVCKDRCCLIHGDAVESFCRLQPLDGSIAIITDPGYGIGWKPRVNHQDQRWRDNEKFNPRFWLTFGDHHCFWGAQYFADLLPVSESWACWVKRPIDVGDFSNDSRTYSTIELAWTDFFKKPAFKPIVWDGGMRQGRRENRTFCHPAQKPVELMAWCIARLPKTVKLVVDPYCGSGTTLLAAKEQGFACLGIEREKKYCDETVGRLRPQVIEWPEDEEPEPVQLFLPGTAD